MSDMSNRFIKCDSLEEWKRAQDFAFQKGYSWVSIGKSYLFVNSRIESYPIYLCFRPDGERITWSHTEGEGCTPYNMKCVPLERDLTEGIRL